MMHPDLKTLRGIVVTGSFTESEVVHLFVLSRKLIEALGGQKERFALLRFYCDWIVHSEIDRSAEGALIVEKLNSIVDYLGKYRALEATAANGTVALCDLAPIRDDLNAALSLDQVRDQLNDLIHQCCQPFRSWTQNIVEFSVDSIRWLTIVDHLLEIICESPLKISGAAKNLRAVRERIVGNPIEGAVIERVSIGKLGIHNGARSLRCIKFSLSDTGRLAALLEAPPARLAGLAVIFVPGFSKAEKPSV